MFGRAARTFEIGSSLLGSIFAPKASFRALLAMEIGPVELLRRLIERAKPRATFQAESAFGSAAGNEEPRRQRAFQFSQTFKTLFSVRESFRVGARRTSECFKCSIAAGIYEVHQKLRPSFERHFPFETEPSTSLSFKQSPGALPDCVTASQQRA